MQKKSIVYILTFIYVHNSKNKKDIKSEIIYYIVEVVD